MVNRVTQGMLNTQFMRNLNLNLTRVQELQNQLSTGRRINKPSDDPVGISFSLRYRSELERNEQYQRNVDSALSWLSFSDEILGQAGDVIQRARELAVQGANGANPQLSLDAIATEIDQLIGQLVNIANSQFNGKYVFNGQLTDVKPYDETAPGHSNPDTGEILFEVGIGVRVAVNVTGDKVFGAPGSADNIFLALENLSAQLRSGDYQGVSDTIGYLDDRLDLFMAARADIGAKVNRIELSEDRLKDISLNLSALQSKTEDADLALVITKLKMDENVYQASLATGSRLLMRSLVDFLR